MQRGGRGGFLSSFPACQSGRPAGERSVKPPRARARAQFMPTLSLQCVVAKGSPDPIRIELKHTAPIEPASQPRKCGELKHT
jgi:hypothetical protein